MKTLLRSTLLATLFLAAAVDASAQAGTRSQGARAVDEPPPPPAIVEADPALEQQVTVRTEGDNSIQEYRANGKVYMVRVTPKHGRPYILRDQNGDGTHTRHENPLDSGVRTPQWVLLEF